MRLSQIEKLIAKFREKPTRNDITYDEVRRIARYYGCDIKFGGKHPIIVVSKSTGRIIPIPGHGKYVKEAYITQLKELFDEIGAAN